MVKGKGKNTVKASKIKKISAKDLFSITYDTRELYDEIKIAYMKKDIMKSNKEVEFHENDGVIFFTTLLKENEKELTLINVLRDYSMVNNQELWKFGFIERKTGIITLLFGGYIIAHGREEAFQYFEIAKTVINSKFKNHKNLITFAQKD